MSSIYKIKVWQMSDGYWRARITHPDQHITEMGNLGSKAAAVAKGEAWARDHYKRETQTEEYRFDAAA